MRNNCGLISGLTHLQLRKLFNSFLKDKFKVENANENYSTLEDDIVKYIYDTHRRDSKENALSKEESAFIDSTFQAWIHAQDPFIQKARVDPEFSMKIFNMPDPRELRNFMSQMSTFLYDAVDTSLPIKVKAMYDLDPIQNRSAEPIIETKLPLVPLATATKIENIQHVEGKMDLKSKFANANTAYSLLERKISNHIVRNYLIDANTNTYNTSAIQIDQAIKNNKVRLYNELIRNFSSRGLTFSENETSYYVDGKLNPNIKNVLTRIETYYASKELTNVTLEHWAQLNGIEIQDYTNFVILSNFDNLLSSYGSDVFKISKSYANSPDERFDKLKYILDITSNISSGVFETGEYDLVKEQSGLFKMFISSMPSVSLDGTTNLDKEVNLNTVNHVMAQLLHSTEFVGAPKFDPTNSLESMKNLLEYAIGNFTSDTFTVANPKMHFKKVEKDTILSIYMYFFRDEAELDTSIKANRVLNDRLRNRFKESYIFTDENGKTKPIPSFYQLAATSRLMTGIDYFNVVVSNFDKTYLNNYTEYTYDKDKKVVTINKPQEKVINTSEIQFTNSLNVFINKDLSGVKNILDSKFKNITLSGNNLTTVTFNMSNHRFLTIDLPTSSVMYTRGKETVQLETVNDFSYREERDLLNILNKVLPQLYLIDENGKDYYYPTYRDIFSDKDKNVTSLADISRVAAYSAFISLGVNSPGGIDNLLKNNWIRSLNTKYYNEEDEEISIAALFPRYNDIAQKIGESLSIINGDVHNGVTKVGNVTVPAVGEVRHLYTIPKWRTWLMAQNGGKLTGMPIQNNLFMVNPDLLKGYMIRSFVNVGDSPKHSSKMSPQEIMTTLILHDYISAMTKYDEVYIQFTVFADKNSHDSVIVNMNTDVKIPGITDKVKLGRVTSEDLKKAIYLNNHTYYKAVSKNITSTYIPVLEGLLGVKVENNLQAVSDAMSKTTEKAFRAAFYKMYNGKEYIIQDLGITVSKAGVPSLSPLLIHYVEMYSQPKYGELYHSMMEKNEKLFVKKLKDFKLDIEFRDGRDKLNPIFSVSTGQGVKEGSSKTIFDKLNIGITLAEFEKKWVDPNTKMLIPHDGTNLNPLLRHFFYMDNYVSENLLQASMGTIHNHPYKGDPNVSLETRESAQQTAEYKRQLQGTPMKPLNSGLINGVGQTMKVVFMTDITNSVFTSFGIQDKMTTSDGSAQVVPLQYILQSNSLLENSVGPNAKMFSIFMDPKYNSYGLTKYAEFGITNEMIKNTRDAKYDLSRLIERSYSYGDFNKTLVRENGEVIHVPLNILKSFKGTDINIDTVAPEGLFYEENGQIYQITSLTDELSAVQSDGTVSSIPKQPNMYTRTVVNLNTGVTTVSPPIEIRNLYSLWKVLGGENSVAIDPEGKHQAKFNFQNTFFTEFDSSHLALAEFVNRVGYKRNNDQKKNIMSKHNLTDSEFTQLFPEFKPIKNNFKIDTQTNTWQPLKDMFIGKFIHSSAQKSGAINIQHIDDVFSHGDIYPVDISVISTGVLMDTDHEVEGSEITRMTQIIGAIEFMGESHNVSKGVYNALADVLNIKLKSLFNNVVTANTDKSALYKEVTDNLIKTFNSKDQQSIGKFIGEMVLRENANMLSGKAQEAEDKNNSEEMSGEEGESSMPVSIMVNNEPMPFSTYMYNSFVSLMSNFLNKTAIRDKQSGIASPIKPSGSMVQVYDNMSLEGELSTHLAKEDAKLNPDDYDNERTINASEVSLYDWVRTPEGTEVYVDTPNKLIALKKLPGDVVQLFGRARDLRPSHITFNVEGVKNAPMSIYELPEFGMIYSFKDIVSAMNDVERGTKKLTEVDKLIKQSPDLVAFLKLKTGEKITPMYIAENIKSINRLLRLNIQNTLNRLETQKTVLINGVEHNITNLYRKSGEGIGPNIYRSMFGLPKGVSVNEVTEDYLLQRILNKAMPKVLNDPLCQYYIQNAEGNHVYIYKEEPNNFIPYKNDELIRTIDGKKWVVDEFGDPKYLIGDLRVGSVLVNGDNIEAIIAPDYTEVEKLQQETKQIDKDLFVGKVFNISEDNNNILIAQSKELAKKRFSSFRTTLSYIAARIPGQGFQSFTDIDVVDFIHTEGNTVMTNHFTSWLKGEDYDIDKGFWLGLTLQNGSIVGWANEFDYSSEEGLRNSMSLPYPDKIQRTINSESPEVILSGEEINSLFEKNMTKLRSQTIQKLGSVNNYNFIGSGQDGEVRNRVEDKVNEYFVQSIPSNRLEDAIKNKMAWGIRDSVTKPSNLTNAETPISMDDPKEASKGIKDDPISSKNPTSKARFQDANMVGKQVIGIAAVALKIWSAASYYANEMVRGGNIDSILIGKNINIDGKNHYIAAQANLNFKTKAATIITDELINDQIQKNNIKENC